MKKFVLIFMTVSLLFTGCSDDGEKKTESIKETVSSAAELSTNESITSETVQTTSKITTPDFVSDSSQKNDTDAEENQVNTPVSDGGLPVIGGDENSGDKPSVTDNPSFSENYQTTTTVITNAPSSGEKQQTTTTTQNTEGVIELPIIPVK
ncbi:hypothetical protein [Porcipelethomonas sp.]|uniref:hypothetical protein n=1 Tax=Porcipelethomonas sp. TaxID=2981675 RepID=UPI003EF3C383